MAVFGLPRSSAIYELRQVIDGKRTVRYFAVCHGVLHSILRDAVERIAEGSNTLSEWEALAAEDGEVLQ